jgi:membrane protein DedA with SNARE-associated domain/membrane-associated phospholipid phosphatase
LSRLSTRNRDLLIALVVIAALIVASQLIPSINAKKVLHDVSTTLGAATYVLAALAAFLETGAFVGLILPGETVVILAGAVAGQGATSIEATIAVVWAGAFAGDSTSFWIGKRLGRDFALHHGSKLGITEDRLERVDRYFERYGGRTVVIGRFIGLVRALAPFTAGTSGWRYRTYLPYCVIGTGLWAAAFCLVGYFASRVINDAVHIAGQVTFSLGVFAAIGVAIYVAVTYIRRADERGRFRAEMIVLGATVAVCLAALIGYGIHLGSNPGPTPLDDSAFRMAADLRTAWLVEVAKVVTWLGSSAVMVPLAVVAGIVLGVRRRWSDLIVLAAALAIVFIAVPEVKALVDRPRPPNPLIATVNQAYPSGHAAHSVIYPFLACLLVARAALPAKRASAVLVAGFLIALIVGLTRVYLRAHYATDVLGGWALGAAAFAGAAAAALLVMRMRQNQRDGAAAG